MKNAPRGAPSAAPNSADDLYESDMAELEARRKAAEFRLRSPFDLAEAALRDFQNAPDIPRPSTAESFIPVLGPAWEAAADLQDGNYGGAVFNGAMAVADALPVGVAVKGLKAAGKGVKIWKDGSLTANAAVKQYRARGVVKPKHEVHHTVPLNGIKRNAQDWRNHFALLKPLPKAQHRRLTGKWDDKPRYDPIRRAWYGTTDWMKAAPTGILGYAADSVENLMRPNPPAKPQK